MKRMNFEKRVHVSPPATPEEALKAVATSDEQRVTLTAGLREIRNGVLGYEGLARASPNLKERMRDLNLARTALANLTKALATPFCNDLIEAMDVELISPRRLSRNSRPPAERHSMQFLQLLPVVKRYVDDMTIDDIRERWNDGSDRRSVNLERRDYETGAVFDLVQKAGFALGEPDGRTVELIRRMFSYTSGKMVGISMVRKRLAAWKTPGKQNTCGFHSR
jgi:hypothetical protein